MVHHVRVFSKGKRLSLDDPRNFLFKQFVKFVAEFKPKYFVLENVPNIVTTSNGYFKDQIIKSFDELGYVVTCGVLCAKIMGFHKIEGEQSSWES